MLFIAPIDKPQNVAQSAEGNIEVDELNGENVRINTKPPAKGGRFAYFVSLLSSF